MTSMALLYILSLAVVLVGALAAWAALAARRQQVVCPDNRALVAVGCDPRDAAAKVFTGGHLHVTRCERWPDKSGCDRACEEQLHR